MDRYQTAAHALLRIIAGLAFTQHGAQKILGLLTDQAPVELFTIRWVAGMLEIIGGPLIALGLLTRPVAFLLAGEMAVAYFWRHLPRDFWPIANGGEPAVLFCFIFLFYAASGAGSWSLDALIARRRGAAGGPTEPLS